MAEFELFENKLIGEGSFGKVFQCHWRGTLAAAKVFNVFPMEGSEVAQEIKMIKDLHNDYILQFFGTAQHNGKPCLITSYAENGSLFQALHRHSLSGEQKPLVIKGLIKGMQYLKSSKVIHRDLKSPNVLLDVNYVPKICDFGLAKLKLNSTTHSKPSSFVGTTRWMAPELFSLKPKYSFASDVYALGIVTWEILTERVPYAENTDIGTIIDFIKKGQSEEIPEDFPELYKYIIKKCWHFKPEDRITVEEICEVDNEALQGADKTIEDIEISATVASMDNGLQHTSSDQQSTNISQYPEGVIPKELEPRGYARILNEYLMKTDGDLDTKYHLALLLDTHDEGFIQWVKAAATHGNDDAAAILGEMYFHGCGVPQDYQAAIEQFSMVAEEERTSDNTVKHGNARAQFNLGWMYKEGRGVPQNDDKAVEWFTKAAEQGYATAQCNLGSMYFNGRGVPQNDDKAVEWFTKAAEQGDAAAQNNLGFMYLEGLGVPQNDDKAVEWLTKAAEQGLERALETLKQMSKDGLGCPQNDDKFFELLKGAAEQGYPDAQARLGWMYANGRVVPQSDNKAAKWYMKAAEQGHATAQFNLGEMYREGRGVPQNDDKAVEWYTKAAEQGNASAQYNLGWMYKEGRGVPQNGDKAIEWLTKAAEQGNSDAQFDLGRMYHLGRGVPQSDDKAVEWYNKAAEQGNVFAQFSLRNMYENGRGGSQRDDNAIERYTKASEQGYASAYST